MFFIIYTLSDVLEIVKFELNMKYDAKVACTLETHSSQITPGFHNLTAEEREEFDNIHAAVLAGPDSYLRTTALALSKTVL